MIYARVDVELRDHDKAQQAGQAMATWTWALLWTRAKEQDGFVAVTSLRGSWVGEKQATRDMAKLVEVGLASVVEGGWTLFGYAAKNETREQIEERRADTRDRKAKSRAKKEDSHTVVTRDMVTPSHMTDAGVTLPYPEPESESEPESKKETIPADAARLVFDPWADEAARRNGGRRPILNDKRRRRINARLAEGKTVAELQLACRGVWLHDWSIDNRQTDIELVCRDDGHVLKFIAIAEAHEAARKPQVFTDPQPEPEPSGELATTDQHDALEGLFTRHLGAA